jgi:alkylmercury lyase
MTKSLNSLEEQMSKLTPEHRAVLRQAFDSVPRGLPMGSDELAARLRMPLRKICQCLEELQAMGFIQTDKGGTIAGAAGLSLSPTRHRLTANGQELYAWCAEDAVGIPAALGWNAKISSSCGQCSSPITIYMAGGEICEPCWTTSVRLWLSDVADGPVCTQTCPHILFFCRHEHGERWAGEHPQNSGCLIKLDEAVEIGRRLWGWMVNSVDQSRYNVVSFG